MPRKSAKNLKNVEAAVTRIHTRSQRKRKQEEDANETAAKQQKPESDTVNVDIKLVNIPSSPSDGSSSSIIPIDDTGVIGGGEVSLDNISNCESNIDPDITKPAFYTIDALCENINFSELRPFATTHYHTYMDSNIYSLDMDECRNFEDFQLPFEFEEEIIDISDSEQDEITDFMP